MKYLVLSLAILISLSACNKDKCSSCDWTMTGVHATTGDNTYTGAGTYNEVDSQAGCEISHEDFEQAKKDQMQESVDFQHALNPRIEMDINTGMPIMWDESYTYTVTCEEE